MAEFSAEDEACKAMQLVFSLKNVPPELSMLTVILLGVHISSVQSLYRLGSMGDKTDYSAEILFQSFFCGRPSEQFWHG